MSQLFDFRSFSNSSELSKDLEENLKFSEFTDSNPSRETEIPLYKGEKLRFLSPWLHCRFGWGGEYNTLSLTSYSDRSFPLDDNSDKRKFKMFLESLGDTVRNYVHSQPNPDNLSTDVINPVTLDSKYNVYKYQFPISREYLDSTGEFEGKVFKSTNVDSLEYKNSSIKAIGQKCYVQFVGFIGKVVQNTNNVRYRVVVEQIHWFPIPESAKSESAQLENSSNLFLNVPNLGKRKVVANTTENKSDAGVEVEYEPSSPVVTTKSSKKSKV